ncbi:MAG: polysaccharide biosynthesis/export family protein [Alistipes sp.]|nr:polysaccharide biosynthesis/export family protein [Alistipes sp.]
MAYLRLVIVGIVVLCGACNAQRSVVYLQDAQDGAAVALPDEYIIRLKPHDSITIVVSCKDPELAAPFNATTSYSVLAGGATTASATASALQVLTVGSDGTIVMPIIGRIECAGLTREELADLIERKIREGGYIAEPSVNVRLCDHAITVVGEVMRPGRYAIGKDKISILEALALAGDMTIYGARDNIAVVRECGGKNIVTRLDIRSAECFASPCYYLEQNDIVIVSPNKSRAATARINQNRSFWVSLASTAISLATLLITIFR